MTRDDEYLAMHAARVARDGRTRTVGDTAARVVLANRRANADARDGLAIERARRFDWPILAYGTAVLLAHPARRWYSESISESEERALWGDR